MKHKNRNYLIFYFTIFLLILVGCKKRPFDFRNKYLGEWDFTTEYGYFNMSDSTSFDTVYNYKGEVWYDEKGKIIIEYREDNILEFEINKEGEITIDDYYDTRGEFSDKNNVSFYKQTGGLGGGTNQSVSGMKK